jgi:hypothetical protein
MFDWDERQEEFLRQPLSGGRLTGAPGSGKTTCLLARALRLVDGGSLPERGGFVVIACSDLGAAEILRRGQTLRAGVFDRDRVTSVGALAADVVRAFLDRSGGNWSADELASRARREVDRASEGGLREGVPCLAAVAAVFVDEAEDLTPAQHGFVSAISDRLRAPLCLVGDPDQRIRDGDERLLLDHPGFGVSLTRSYRVPRPPRTSDDGRPRQAGEIAESALRLGKTVAAVSATSWHGLEDAVRLGARRVSVEESKGREFDVVLVDGTPPADATRESWDRMMRVAVSRAREEVTVYGGDQMPDDDTGRLVHAWPEVSEAGAALLSDAVGIAVRPIDHAGRVAGGAESVPWDPEMARLRSGWAKNAHAHLYRGGAPPVLARVEALIEAREGSPAAEGCLRARFGGGPWRWEDVYAHRRALVCDGVWGEVEEFRPACSDGYLNARFGSGWDACAARDAVASAKREMSTCGRMSAGVMWRLCVSEWQHDRAGVWAGDRAGVWASGIGVDEMSERYEKIRAIAEAEPDGLLFRVPVSMACLPVIGTADAVDPVGRRAIEYVFGFVGSPSDAVRAWGNAEMAGGRDAASWKAEVHDLRTGERWAVETSGDRWRAACAVSDAVGSPLRGTAWLYDLETTGLDTERCGLLEVHMEEYRTGWKPLSTLVRQQIVPAKITQLTGISAEDTAGAMSQELAAIEFRRALERCDRPKLLAHNGDRFDHAIMKRLGAVPDGTILMDTMRVFPLAAMPRRARGESKSLGKVYEAVFGGPFAGTAHRAEADVRMMREILDASGAKAFV